MTIMLFLAMSETEKPFVVETDTSRYELGAVLIQYNRSIAYYSCTLGTIGRSKPIYEKEFIAIVKAVLKWRHYIMGRRFIVRTDQLSLKYTCYRSQLSKMGVLKLIGFTFEI